METAEHREPYESRGSRTDLGAPGGDSPPGDSTIWPVSMRASQRPESARRRHPPRSAADVQRDSEAARIGLSNSPERWRSAACGNITVEPRAPYFSVARLRNFRFMALIWATYAATS